MPRRGLNASSLGALVAFEAAARRANFRLAAHELGVTPGAVSRQIKALEEDLGVRLFQRLQRGVRLTPEGTELQGVLGSAFGSISDTLARLRGRAGAGSVTLATTHAITYFWLMPRLGAFWRRHPELTLNQIVSDDPAESRLSTVDLAIRYCDGPEADEDGVRLFGDVVYPVCSPELLARVGPVPDLATLVGLPLIDFSGIRQSWIPWSEWLRLNRWRGAMPDFRRVNSPIIAVQAALDGQGVVLGWDRLIAPLIREGSLVRVTTLSIPAPSAYYALWPAQRALRPEAHSLLEWLLTHGEQPDSQTKRQ